MTENYFRMVPVEGQLRTVNHVGQIWVICPRCHQGRWVIAGRVNHLSFSGLCGKCNLEIAEEAYKPYRNTANIIKLRNIIREAKRSKHDR